MNGRLATTTTTTSTSPSSSWPTRAGHGLRARPHHNHHQRKAFALTATKQPSEPSAALTPASGGAPLAAFAAALAVFGSAAAAVAPPAALAAAETPAATAPKAPATVYFGNGCYWGRMYDFVKAEKEVLSRPPERVSAVAGYAGGTGVGPDGRVCYHFNDPRQVYERLGHAEVVSVELDGLTSAAADDGGAAPSLSQEAEREMRAFSKTYFGQFRRLRDGRFQRLDPQDAGPGYRNVVGLPGGVRSPLFEVLKSEAPAGMQLREGQGRASEIGGAGAGGGADEGDELSVVWVVDSSKLPFYRAEQYHQYHRGMEGSFPASYLKEQRDVALKQGRIDPTGCLEFPF